MLMSFATVDTPVIRKTYQLQAVLIHPNMTEETVFSKAIAVVSNWLVQKLSKVSGAQEALKNPYQCVEYAPLDDISVNIAYDERNMQWACKYVQRDNEVVARTWTTQVSICKRDGGIYADALNLCSSPKSCDSPVPYNTPIFVVELHKQIGLIAVRPLDAKPWYVRNAADVDELYDFVQDPNRSLPVLILTPANGYTEDLRYLVDEGVLANRVRGAAFVVALNLQSMEFWRTKGKQWAVYGGAIRTYLPGVDFVEGDARRHPFILKDSILEQIAVKGRDGFLKWLETTVRSKGIQYAVDYSHLRLFNDINHSLREMRRKEFEMEQQNSEELLDRYKRENEDLKNEIAEWEKEVAEMKIQKESAENDWFSVSEELDEQRQKMFYLQARLDDANKRLDGLGAPKSDVPYPDSLDELDNWCARYYPSELYLSGKARRGARASQYRDNMTIYRVLDFLATAYRDFRMNKITMDEYEARFADYELTKGNIGGKAITDTGAGRHGDEYYFHYYDKKVRMENHICKGNARSCADTMRVYFTWDAETNTVLIGWLPSHLSTEAT